uniref:RUN and SH3 domain containing 2 n=1 Tax=Oncorhynchus tshawytscha TaxID=74940 RepID=A0A8C8EQW0_ONCTS
MSVLKGPSIEPHFNSRWGLRSLVKAINTAVDLIVAHFGTSRDPDVKAKLGNSWVSPNVGHLILKYLCPALREVLGDGLKAYVLDLIIGQRRNQPWSLVEASTQLGPSTRVLHSLFSKVSQYSEFTSHSMRLNAFIFGLLNLRSLEFWFNHLYTHEDIVATHYHPWGFLPLSQRPCQPLFEEFLLLLQPLSLLPFDLDLLFEPRLVQKGQEHRRRKEQLCSASTGEDLDQSARSTFQLMRGWSTESRRADQREGESEGGKEERRKERERDWAEEGHQRQERDRQACWWYQLMQSSQVYIDQSAQGGSKFVKTEKRKKSAERRSQLPPPREGVVEGAESSQDEEGLRERGRRRLSWMGSPPESLLTQDKENETELGAPVTGAPEASVAQPAAQAEFPSQGQGMRWGRLFGSSIGGGGTPSRPELPSGWLTGLDMSVLDLVAQTVGVGTGKRVEPSAPMAPPTLNQPSPPLQTAQETLCHHIATEPNQLSFQKGDVLRVLSRADSDWLLCSLGAQRGLVPFIYVTLRGMEDSQVPQWPQGPH